MTTKKLTRVDVDKLAEDIDLWRDDSGFRPDDREFLSRSIINRLLRLVRQEADPEDRSLLGHLAILAPPTPR